MRAARRQGIAGPKGIERRAAGRHRLCRELDLILARSSFMQYLSEYYRARVAECEWQAEQTNDERIRQHYRLLAEHWRLLLEQFEKHGL